MGLAKPAEEFSGGFLKIERCDVAFSLSVLQLSPSGPSSDPILAVSYLSAIRGCPR